MDEKKFIDAIKRLYPDSGIKTKKDAIKRIKDTEYEYIYSDEIHNFSAKNKTKL